MLSKINSKILIVLLVLAAALVSLSFATRSAKNSATDRSYDAIEQMRAGIGSVESKVRAANEYQLGERYGQTPQEYAKQQIARKFWLGERYGQTVYNAIEQLRNGRRITTDRFYDNIEAIRLER
jgi:hypothetical protein